MSLTRIYQGRILKVELPKKASEPPIYLSNWQDILWDHHCLFQDAVNYYTLMLAALAYEIKPQNDEYSQIIKNWARQVEITWKTASKKSKTFEGPHNRICRILGNDPSKSDFKDCVKTILQNCKPDANVRAEALLALLVEADKSDLNQVCVTRLPWLCSENLDAATSQQIKKQEEGRKDAILAIHQAKNLNELSKAVDLLDPFNFLTKYPENKLSFNEFAKLAQKYFDKICKKHPGLEKYRQELTQKSVKDDLLLSPGRKTKSSFPYALILKLMPKMEIAEIFKQITESEYKKISKDNNASSNIVQAEENAFEKLRFENNNKNPFEYFTNIVMKKGKSRAVWFEFDKMAFIEAINYPHRFYEDTKRRNEEAKELEKMISAMEKEGGKIKQEEADDENEEKNLEGFKDDIRIDLIRKLVTENLGWLSDVEGTEDKEYSIDSGTIRGFEAVKEKWLQKFSDKSEPTEEELCKIVAEQQAAHRDDFGSAPLFCELAKREFWSIWRDPKTKGYHPEDPIKAWIKYNELKSELKDKKRCINFTPAHPIHSPRYFDFTKTDSFSIEHNKNSFSFSAGIAVKKDTYYIPIKLQFTYSAPRLLRDHLRSNNEKDLSKATWLQPMMEALGMNETNAEHANFENAKVSLMAYSPNNFQIVFPIKIETNKLHSTISSKNWNGQFLFGGKEKLSFLMWQGDKKAEKQDKKPIDLWTNKIDSFSCLSVDLGQRNAAAIARIEVQNSKPKNGAHRFIGNDGKKDWYAKIVRTKMLRLPGEDQEVWREKTKMDSDNLQNSAFREEIFGSKGRKATGDEIKQAKKILKELEIKEDSIMPNDWENILSFPEQNDKLLVAIRRAQSIISRLHKWAYCLNDSKKENLAIDEIKTSEFEDLKKIIGSKKMLYGNIKSLIQIKQDILTNCLVQLANRILPLRGRSWKWKNHPGKETCFILVQEGPPVKGIKIRGQRGLSLARIEQITELRKRLQSLNQLLRRKIGEKAPAHRDDSIPDCCPDALEKLEDLREQRVNQTAHMILAEALGICLDESNSSAKKKEPYRHGSYKKILNKNGKWIGPVDFIVIEDLSRYLTQQGRSRRENSRLMKWCHRAIRDKLKDMMSVFFAPCAKFNGSEIPPLLEIPAAYSSRFCSRSAVAGFRAVELAPGFEKEAPWRWMLEKESKNNNTQPGHITKLINDLKQINSNNPKIPRTLYAPIQGGPLFIPASKKSSGKGVLQPKISQADINAAINIGLRAIANPTVFEINQRLRSKKENKDFLLKEKRIADKNSRKRITLLNGEKIKDKNPNFFADFGEITLPGQAQLEGFASVPLALGKDLWKTIEENQWKICDEINQKRILRYKK